VLAHDTEVGAVLLIAFQALIERLKTRYTLGYYPGTISAAGANDARFHKLEVRLTSAHGEKGEAYLIVAKQGYFPPRRSRLTR